MNKNDLARADLTLDDLAHRSANQICSLISEAGGRIFDRKDVQRLRERLGVDVDVSMQVYEYTPEDVAQWATEWLPVELGGRGWSASQICQRHRLEMTTRRVQQLVRLELMSQFPELAGKEKKERTAVDVLVDLIRAGQRPQPLSAGGGLLAAPKDDAEAALHAEYRALARPRGGWHQALLLAYALAADPEIRPGETSIVMDRKRLRKPMAVRIQGFLLKKAARLGAKIAASKGSAGADVMKKLRLRASAGVLELTASDLRVTAISSFPCTVETEGATLVPAELFKRVADRFDDDAEVQISPVKNWLSLTSEALSFKVACASVEQYPRLQATEGLELTELGAVNMARAAAELTYAASKSEDYPQFQGVWLQPEGEGARWISADGHRVATFTTVDKLPWTEPVLLPAGVFSWLPASERTSIGVTASRVEIETDEVFWLVQRLNVHAPDWGHFLKEPKPTVRATVKRRDFLKVVRSVMVASDRGFPLFEVEFGEDRLMVRTKNYETGEASAELRADVSGARMILGVNGRYLADALSASKARKVELSTDGERGAVRIISGDARHMITPCRL